MHLKSFLDYLLLEKNYSVLTIKSYKTDINAFADFIEVEFQEKTIDNVNYTQIRSWIIHLVEGGLTNRSVNRKISALNTYYKFLLKTKTISINPLAKHRALKTSKKVQIPFSVKEINGVLDDFDFKDDFTGVRDRFIIELFYSTGIRRIELIELKLNSFDIQAKTLKVLGKRNKERIIPLLDSVLKHLQAYLNKRQTLERIVDAEYLFLSQKGVKMYETLVYRIINTYFSKVASKVKKSPHILRHSFATHLLNEGADINTVKELLGHASLTSTQVYTHNSIAELKKVYIKAHPRSKNSKN